MIFGGRSLGPYGCVARTPQKKWPLVGPYRVSRSQKKSYAIEEMLAYAKLFWKSVTFCQLVEQGTSGHLGTEARRGSWAIGQFLRNCCPSN